MVSVISTVTQARVVNRYAHWHLGQPYGYTDKAAGADSWQVKGLGFHAPPNYIVAMMLHRAAMLAKAAGFNSFKVVSLTYSCGSGGGGFWWWKSGPQACNDERIRDHEGHLTIVGTQGSEGLSPCASTSAGSCYYVVADVLRDTASLLDLTPDEENEESADILRRAPKRN